MWTFSLDRAMPDHTPSRWPRVSKSPISSYGTKDPNAFYPSKRAVDAGGNDLGAYVAPRALAVAARRDVPARSRFLSTAKSLTNAACRLFDPHTATAK